MSNPETVCYITIRKLGDRLNQLRINATGVRLNAGDVTQEGISRMTDRDVVVRCSFPPYFTPAANITKFAALRGAKAILMTDSPAPSAARAALEGKGLCLYCDTITKYFFNSLTAPVSLIGALTECIVAEMGKKLIYCKRSCVSQAP